MRVVIIGAGGRMGQALLREAEQDSVIDESLAIFSPRQTDLKRNEFLLRDFGKARIASGVEEVLRATSSIGGAVIDFTPAALEHARIARACGCAFVCGTTGFSTSEMSALRDCASGCALVYAANFSLGIALLSSLVENAARVLPSLRYDAEIMEMHHREKKDSPSGTALRLGAAITAGRGCAVVESKGDRSGVRKSGDVGYGVLRGGSIVGEHRVMFAGEYERLTLSHESYSRAVFAEGALASALWLRDKATGFYTINDVLSLQP